MHCDVTSLIPQEADQEVTDTEKQFETFLVMPADVKKGFTEIFEVHTHPASALQ